MAANLGRDVQFQVDIDRCGSGGVTRVRKPTAGASNSRPVRADHATSNNPTPPLLPGAPWTLGHERRRRPARLVHAERPHPRRHPDLKRSQAAWKFGQQARYWRYAARSREKLLLYVFSYQLPSQAFYARRVVSCLRVAAPGVPQSIGRRAAARLEERGRHVPSTSPRPGRDGC